MMQSINWKTMVQAPGTETTTLISGITRAKRAEDVTQVVEHLLGKCEALGSNPITAKQTNKKSTMSYCFPPSGMGTIGRTSIEKSWRNYSTCTYWYVCKRYKFLGKTSVASPKVRQSVKQKMTQKSTATFV
jgi:hypothetical protein